MPLYTPVTHVLPLYVETIRRGNLEVSPLTETARVDTGYVKWSSYILRGIVALIIGFLVLLWPNYAVGIAMILYGILLLFASVQALVLGFGAPKGVRPVGLIVIGFLGLILGVIAILFPRVTALALALIIALLTICTGVIEIAAAILHPELNKYRPMLGLTGALAVIFGGIYFFLPGLGTMDIVSVYLGFFAILYALLSIVTGFYVKGAKKMPGA
jgi:uncharacterized membrane protein HdeD (DUF308 family)